MKKELTIPDIGDADSIELVCWHKKAGDSFKEGEELCDLVTDKAAFCLEPPGDGKVIETFIEEESQVTVGQKAVLIELN